MVYQIFFNQSNNLPWWRVYSFPEREASAGTFKAKPLKSTLLGWTDSLLATCLWDAQFPDAHCLWLLMNLELSGKGQ